MIDVNYIAVVVSAVAAMALGFFWYGPIFGKQWVAYMGWSESDMEEARAKGMAKSYSLMIVSTLLMSYMLANGIALFAVAYPTDEPLSTGLVFGMWSWLAFVVPVTLSSVIWEGKPWGYWFLTAGYYLVSLSMMGA